MLKKAFLWIGLLVLAFVALAAGVLLYEGWQKHERDKPRLVSSYEGVALGDSREQVLYALGEPGWRETAERKREVHKAGDRDALTAAPLWEYQRGADGQVAAQFSGDKVSLVVCFSNSFGLCQPLFGIRDGSSEDEVLEHLGKPEHDALREGVRVLVYKRYNAQFYLKQRRVYGVQVATAE